MSPQQSIGKIGDLHVQCTVRTRIPTEDGNFYVYLYSNNEDNKEHLAIVYDEQVTTGETEGAIKSKSLAALKIQNSHDTSKDISRPTTEANLVNGDHNQGTPTLVRVHSECFTGEILGSQRCDCGEQLHTAMKMMAKEGRGIILYLRQEGRGIGLYNKLRAYNLQDKGYDTVEANILLNRLADERSYEICGRILNDLGVGRVRLLTNNPDKINALLDMGIEIVERIEMKPVQMSSELLPYLETKIAKLNHILQL